MHGYVVAMRPTVLVAVAVLAAAALSCVLVRGTRGGAAVETAPVIEQAA